MVDGRETEVVKIGEYDFHFWKEYKGGETRKTLALISSGEGMDEKSMQSI
jgi:tricorn protease-like protein